MVPMCQKQMRPRRRAPDAPRILSAGGAQGLAWSRPSSNGAAVTLFTIFENGIQVAVTLPDQLTWQSTPTAGASYQVSATNAVGMGRRSAPVVAS